MEDYQELDMLHTLIKSGLEKLRARSCPCTYRACKSSLTYMKKRERKLFLKIISQLENYLYCLTKTFFAVQD